MEQVSRPAVLQQLDGSWFYDNLLVESNDPKSDDFKVIARTVVLIVTVLAWLPAVTLFLIGGHAFALLLPVMGFCPLPNRSGDPGYCESCAHLWGGGLLVGYALLGSLAIWRKSTVLSVGFAVLLIASVLLVILRGNASLNGFGLH